MGRNAVAQGVGSYLLRDACLSYQGFDPQVQALFMDRSALVRIEEQRSTGTLQQLMPIKSVTASSPFGYSTERYQVLNTDDLQNELQKHHPLR
jgi:hypothetical protein